MGNARRIRHSQVHTKEQWTLVQQTVGTWFQPYRISPDSAISICCFKTHRDTAIWENDTREKIDRLLAIRHGHKVPLGIDSLKIPDRGVKLINHTKMIPDLDHDPTNFSGIATAIRAAYEELRGELESIPPEYVPKESSQDPDLDLRCLEPKRPQPRISTRGSKQDTKETDRKKYENKWTILQEAAEELEYWIPEVLSEHTLAVDGWLRRKVEEWNAASVDNALLRECGDLDPSLYLMAQLSQRELLKRALQWKLNDLDAQKDILRTLAKSKTTFTGKERDSDEQFDLRDWCFTLAQKPERLLDSIVNTNRAIRELKQSLPDTMLSEWNVSDTSSEELEGFLKKLQEEAASLANTGVIDALNTQLQEAQASVIREKKEAAERELKAKTRARQLARDRAVPTSIRKTNPFGVFIRNFSMKDIEPLSTRQMTAEETQLEWTRPSETVFKPTLYKPPREFKGSYDSRDTRNWKYYLERLNRGAQRDSELYRQRQEILAQRSKAASERQSREREAIRLAHKLQSESESKSVAEIKQMVEETWGTTLPEATPLLKIPVWDPAEYTQKNTRPRAWNFIHHTPSRCTDTMAMTCRDAPSSKAQQDIADAPAAGTSDEHSDSHSVSDSQNSIITPATTSSEASDVAADEDLLKATSEDTVPYQRQRSMSVPDFRPDYIENHMAGYSLAEAIMREGAVDDSSVKDTQTHVAQTPFVWPDEVAQDEWVRGETATVMTSDA